MLVSHESPLQLLQESLTYNDYDYCLVHLLEQYPEYLSFFKESVKNGRRVLLDNGMFELKKSFQSDKFAQWVVDLKPYEYIVPDVYGDSIRTIENFEEWKKNHKDLPGVKIGVVQGLSYKELADCYEYMSHNADKIAISFNCPYFRMTGYAPGESNEWVLATSGRQKFIMDMIIDDIWDGTKKHHLLGCALPQEFGFYMKNDCIESMDTSNPIVAGIHNILYSDHGLDTKITTLLADLLEAKLDENQLSCIRYNIKKFREINNINKE
jgi:hypothetical protein